MKNDELLDWARRRVRMMLKGTDSKADGALQVPGKPYCFCGYKKTKHGDMPITGHFRRMTDNDATNWCLRKLGHGHMAIKEKRGRSIWCKVLRVESIGHYKVLAERPFGQWDELFEDLKVPFLECNADHLPSRLAKKGSQSA